MTGEIIPFPGRSKPIETPPVNEPGLSVWQSQLMAMAIYSALDDRQKVAARAFLTATDPLRTDPATGRLEQLFRRIRQIS